MPYQPHKTVYRTGNPKLLATTGVSIYPLYNPVLLTMSSGQLKAYGQFLSSVTQSLATLNTPIPLTYDSSTTYGGITYTGSQITAPLTGTYFVSVSIQIVRAVGNSASNILSWVRINGTDLALSSSQIHLATQVSSTLMTYTIMLNLTAGQHFQIMFANDETPGHVVALATTGQTTPYVAPAIPSVITDVFYMGA